MTREEKDLLLKDLCARLPYRIKCLVSTRVSTYTGIIESIGLDESIEIIKDNSEFIHSTAITNCKPYLFPLSSMTEEQKEEYVSLQQRVIYNSQGPVNLDVMKYIDWCYKHHIDINGLIPIGLALDATGLNIY